MQRGSGCIIPKDNSAGTLASLSAKESMTLEQFVESTKISRNASPPTPKIPSSMTAVGGISGRAASEFEVGNGDSSDSDPDMHQDLTNKMFQTPQAKGSRGNGDGDLSGKVTTPRRSSAASAHGTPTPTATGYGDSDGESADDENAMAGDWQ